MATDFNQESVMRFLLRNGGHVRNGDLLTHFKEFLREHEDRLQNRELFKSYVNAVATVKQEDGVSYVVLRKKYRAHLGDVATSADTPGTRTDKKQEGAGRKPNHGQDPSPNTQLLHVTSHTDRLLPVAGIINKTGNHLKSVYLDKAFQTSSHQPWQQKVSSVPSRDRAINTCTLGMSSCSTDSKRSSGSGQSFGQPSGVKGISEKHNGAKPEQLREADGCSQKSFHPPPPSYPHCEVSVTPPSMDRVHKHTLPSSYRSFDQNPSDAWPFSIPLRQSQISASSPCLVETPGNAFFFNSHVQAGLSRSNENLLRPDCYGQAQSIYISEPHDYAASAEAPVSSSTLQRNSIPLETSHPRVAYTHLEPKCFHGLSSSQNSLIQPHSSMSSDWPQALPQDNWSSDDALNYHSDVLTEGGEQTLSGKHHSHEVRLLSQLHHQERQFTPWHNSTGNLLDKEPQAPLPSSEPNESTRNRPIARRLSHHIRSRMCRSLGADLDKAFREDGDKARLKRLHRITSFLNVSSSHTHSPLDSVSPASSVRSLGHESSSCGHRNVHVPLEPQEHEWFVKAATGNWTDIYSLFREDPNLLAKRDFVSGYTVLHWIAKHGDHRVLNTLWYGVQKTGMTLVVDTRSTCGYTPLHLAAIHGHKNLLRLLVHKFKANVALRDNNGKKPWQYLSKINDRDLFELLGAPQVMIEGSEGVQWSSDRPPVAPINRSAATVKRHTSLAALFKQKSQLRVSANAEPLQ